MKITKNFVVLLHRMQQMKVSRKFKVFWNFILAKCSCTTVNSVFRDVPERLPISVPIRLGSAKGSIRRSEHLPNTNPLFYRVSMSARTKKSTAVSYEAKPVIKQKLQYFIHQDWSSEKISWNHLHKYVPEFQKTSWIC